MTTGLRGITCACPHPPRKISFTLINRRVCAQRSQRRSLNHGNAIDMILLKNAVPPSFLHTTLTNVALSPELANALHRVVSCICPIGIPRVVLLEVKVH